MEDIDDLLYKIEEEITNGKKSIFGGGVTVDGQAIFDIIDKIRANLPDVIREARYIVSSSEKRMKEEMLRAKKIIESAEQRKLEILSESAIIAQAEAEAKVIKDEANDYFHRVLSDVKGDIYSLLEDAETALNKSLNAIGVAKERL